jgi:hypothetical protein
MRRGKHWPYWFVVVLSLTVGAVAEDLGRFKGEAVTTMLTDGRTLKLVKTFGYVDPKGREWNVPAGAETDGASVPRILWLTHPPFTGKYRLASIIHDYYCQVRSRKWQDTHRVFYDAMRTAGVSENTAKAMYGAVYNFGPRWGIGVQARGPGTEQYPTPEEQAQFMRDLEGWIGRDNPSRDEIEKALDKGRIPR